MLKNQENIIVYWESNMADNDKNVILKESEIIKFTNLDWLKDKVFKIIFPIFLWSIGYKTFGKGKTRAEYEDMIAESIYNHTMSVYKNSCDSGLNPNELEKIEEESKEPAKAVVDRLFGEGE